MGKKRRHPNVEELINRPWCYYCERDFEDLKLLISHQKAKHYKCERCGKRLNTAGGLSVHMTQVHKESLTQVENALPNRQGLDIEIFGMEGMPEDILRQHNQRIIHEFYREQADRFAKTGNPPPGQSGGQGPAKKRVKLETEDEIKKRLSEHRAKVRAAQASGLNGPPSANGQSPTQGASPFAAPPGNFSFPPLNSAPGFPPSLPPGSSSSAAGPPGAFSLPPRPACGSNLPQRPPYGTASGDAVQNGVGSATPGPSGEIESARMGDGVGRVIRMAETKASEETKSAVEQRSKKDKEKSVKMVYNLDISPEEKLAMMPRYAFAPQA